MARKTILSLSNLLKREGFIIKGMMTQGVRKSHFITLTSGVVRARAFDFAKSKGYKVELSGTQSIKISNPDFAPVRKNNNVVFKKDGKHKGYLVSLKAIQGLIQGITPKHRLEIALQIMESAPLKTRRTTIAIAAQRAGMTLGLSATDKRVLRKLLK